MTRTATRASKTKTFALSVYKVMESTDTTFVNNVLSQNVKNVVIIIPNAHTAWKDSVCSNKFALDVQSLDAKAVILMLPSVSNVYKGTGLACQTIGARGVSKLTVNNA